MPRTSQQNQQIREATRAKLLHSSMALFGELGYASTPVRRIARYAGVSTGLLYHYFDGKEGLLQAVFDDCMFRISEGFAGVEGVPTAQGKIAYLVGYIFTTLQEERIFWGLFYSLRSQPAVLSQLGDAFRLWTARLRNLFIEYLQAAGKPEAVLEAYLLYSLIEGTIQQYLLDPEDYPLDAVVEAIIDRFAA